MTGPAPTLNGCTTAADDCVRYMEQAHAVAIVLGKLMETECGLNQLVVSSTCRGIAGLIEQAEAARQREAGAKP